MTVDSQTVFEQLRGLHASFTFQLPLGRCHFFNHGPMFIMEDQEREPLDEIKIIGTQRRVVESTSQVCVPIFVEFHHTIFPLGINLDLGLQQRTPILLTRRKLSVIILDHDVERVGVVGLRRGLALTKIGFDSTLCL